MSIGKISKKTVHWNAASRKSSLTPTPEETLQILRNIKERYEEHHNVRYTDEALQGCVKLTDRYVTDRTFPDKAIDALDEAGARVHISNIVIPKSIEQMEAELKKWSSRKPQ